MKHVVQLKKATKQYQKGDEVFTAVKDVSFEIEDLEAIGEFLCIRLPSKRLLRYFRPFLHEGQICYEGIDTYTRRWRGFLASVKAGASATASSCS